MSTFESDSLPREPLSMGLLVSLEPPSLRRLLRSGLRLGLSQADLDRLLQDDLGLSPQSESAQLLLAALTERGWFCWNSETARWKTRLA